jgi:peptide/nickel transport system permease protein
MTVAVRPSATMRLFAGLRRVPFAVGLSFAFLGLLVFVFLFADLLATHDITAQDLTQRLKRPALLGGPAEFLLGTDELGRDIYSRLLFAIRTSMLVAIMGSLIGAILGTLLGFVAAHFRGLVEDTIMMLVDWQSSIPFIVIALATLAFLGTSFGLVVLLIGLQGWDNYARLVRGLVLSANGQGYAVAISGLGATPAYVYGRHILPNIAAALMVQFSLNFPETILLEASLSFLGMGVQPPMTSLGLMLGSGRRYLLLAWWISVLPGVAIFLTTLSISLVGDWLRDRLDPTLR